MGEREEPADDKGLAVSLHGLVPFPANWVGRFWVSYDAIVLDTRDFTELYLAFHFV